MQTCALDSSSSPRRAADVEKAIEQLTYHLQDQLQDLGPCGLTEALKLALEALREERT